MSSKLEVSETSTDRQQLDQQLCFPLYASSNLVMRLYRPLLKPFGLTYPQYLVLMVLWQFRSLSVSELGERLYLDSGTLTPLLKRMEAAGWVERVRSTVDERRVLATLTPEGIKLKSKMADIPSLLACQVQHDSDSVVRLRDELNALARQMDQALKQCK